LGKFSRIALKWITHELRDRFQNRILDFDLATASLWAQLQAQSELQGTPMPAIDGQIAATVALNNLTVVTRNISDMKISGVALYNPW
jgi:predicted nucleic acid-binding protein